MTPLAEWITMGVDNIHAASEVSRTNNYNLLIKGNTFSPEVASNLCLIHVSTPNSKSNMRIKEAAKCAETWRIPIITLLFRETFEGTNVIVVTNNNTAPAKDTYEPPIIEINAFHTVPKKLFN